MTIHTFSSWDFTRDVSASMRVTLDGPVFISDRARPVFALLRIDDYYGITDQNKRSLLDVIDGIRGEEAIDFNPSKLNLKINETSLIEVRSCSF